MVKYIAINKESTYPLLSFFILMGRVMMSPTMQRTQNTSVPVTAPAGPGGNPKRVPSGFSTGAFTFPCSISPSPETNVATNVADKSSWNYGEGDGTLVTEAASYLASNDALIVRPSPTRSMHCNQCNESVKLKHPIVENPFRPTCTTCIMMIQR